MKNIEYLVGSENITDSPLPVYSEEAIDFTAELSRLLMRSPVLRLYPDISALAFWCRKANINKLKEKCSEADKRVGRGLCFHVAPGNIPINFAFSYIFGLMAGCSNVVRLSSKNFPQIQPVCDAVNEALKDYPEISARTAFVRYDHDDEITAEFCAKADARLIWGGDQTIANVRSVPSKPRCIDVCFADRYSICMIDGEAVLKADDLTFARLIENFYNDTYLMDQNACSSEQLILWVNDSVDAREKFWCAVEKSAEKKYILHPALGVDKYTHMFEDILDERPVKVVKHNGMLYRVELEKLDGDLTKFRGKGGYFYEYSLNSLDELAPFVTPKFQTVNYFGINPEEIRNYIVKNHLRGIDRIVPIGKAMDIGIMWDGFDLVRMLSRYVDVV